MSTLPRGKGNILSCLQIAEASLAFSAYFITESITSHPQTMLSFISSSLTQQHIWDLNKPPLSYKEAMTHPDSDLWKIALNVELRNFVDKEVIKECMLSFGKKAIGSY